MISPHAHRTGTKGVACLSFYLFLCLFAPPVLPDINFVLVLAALSIPYLVSNASTAKELLSSRAARSFCGWFSAYVVYWIIIMLVNALLSDERYISNYITSAYSFFLVVPTCLICATTALVYKSKHRLTSSQVIKAFILAGMAQSAFALAAFFDQGIKDALTTVMFENTGISQMQEGSWIAERRFYGFANSMLDLYGFGTGILAALPAFLVLFDRKTSKAWVFTIPVLLIVPFLNARTGLVLFALAIAVASLYAGRISGLSVVATMATVLMVALIAMVVLGVIAAVRPEIIDWLLGDILGTTQHNTFSILFGESFWNLPDPLLIVTGTGHSVYSITGFTHSDVGFVNEIWRTGIIGLLLLIGAFVRPTAIVLTETQNDGALRYLLVATVVCLAVVAVKCMPITHSGGMIFLVTLILLCGSSAELSKGGDAVENECVRERSSARL